MEDSELITKIKSYGILDETDIKIEGGHITTKGMSSIDTPWDRGFAYHTAFVKKQNTLTKVNLKHDQQIVFLPTNDVLPTFSYEDNILNSINNDDVSSEEDTNYPLVYKAFLDNNMSVKNLGLAYEEEVILKCSKINVLFDYPNRQYTMMQITADDVMRGFTVGELALKVMQRYHMLYYLNFNYNLKEGKMIDEPHTFEWKRAYVQPPIPTGEKIPDYRDNEYKHITRDNTAFEHCFGEPFMEWEWADNGVKCLKYDKQTNYWKVICMDYI